MITPKERLISFNGPMVRATNREVDPKTQTRRIAKNLDLCPYGQPGDLLGVKEAAWMWCERRPNGTTKKGRQKWRYVPLRKAPIHYQADHPSKPTCEVASPDTLNVWMWRLKIARFLPRRAIRTRLQITDVRRERLQDITLGDICKEGLARSIYDFKPVQSGLRAWHDLWESIHGLGSWATNDWVWVVSFRRVKP